MFIDFDKIETSTIPNFYNGEKNTVAQMYVDDLNRIMRGTLEPEASIGSHKHETGSEIIFILQGTGKALCNDEQEILSPGSCHYCPKGNSHSLINDGVEDLIFFAVVAQQ